MVINFKPGKMIRTTTQFDHSTTDLFIYKLGKYFAKIYHRSWLIGMPYKTLHDWIVSGRLYEAKRIKK